MVGRIVATIAVCVFVLAGSPTRAAVELGDSCQEGKNEAAWRKAFDLLRAFARSCVKVR